MRRNWSPRDLRLSDDSIHLLLIEQEDIRIPLSTQTPAVRRERNIWTARPLIMRESKLSFPIVCIELDYIRTSTQPSSHANTTAHRPIAGVADAWYFDTADLILMSNLVPARGCKTFSGAIDPWSGDDTAIDGVPDVYVGVLGGFGAQVAVSSVSSQKGSSAVIRSSDDPLDEAFVSHLIETGCL